jgi:hypothetical protein
VAEDFWQQHKENAAKRAMPMEKKPIFVLQTDVEGGSPERGQERNKRH